FPSVTRLNAASMVTGCFPGAHGLHGNLSLVPEYHPTEPMDALEPQLTELRNRGAKVLLVPTLAEILADNGMEYIAAGVGTSGQAFIHHPNHEDGKPGATIHTDYALPRSLFLEMTERFGPWPEKQLPNSPRMERVATIFTDYVLGERAPDVALLWFSEPDSSEHGTGPNSPTTRQAATDADREFGRVLDWIADQGLTEAIDVIVTTDHGQATITEAIPVRQLLLEQGFAAPGEAKGVVAAGNGGSALFYVEGHDSETLDRLASWLMAQPWAGPMFASEQAGAIEGTLPASLIGLEGPRVPDLIFSFGWKDGLNEHGQPGFVYSFGGTAGRGTHGSLSPWEFRSFTAALGPAFKTGSIVEETTGHADLAPTVLKILGIEQPAHMQGQAIEAALADGPDSVDAPHEEHVASRTIPGGEYRQQLVVRRTPHGAHILSAAVSTASLSEAAP
ncbi:MAG: alkaline phosphatase family protein, partial [Dehalococcoidia bacterium]